MKKRKQLTRRGLTAMEVLVSAFLLVALIGLTAPLQVQMNRVWKDSQFYRLAEHEVANQLEKILSLKPSERSRYVDSLSVSERLLERFPQATLRGEQLSGRDGSYVTLRFDWGTRIERSPIELTAMLDASPASQSSESESGEVSK